VRVIPEMKPVTDLPPLQFGGRQAAELKHCRKFDGVNPARIKPANFALPGFSIPIERCMRSWLNGEAVMNVNATGDEGALACGLRRGGRVFAARCSQHREASGGRARSSEKLPAINIPG